MDNQETTCLADLYERAAVEPGRNECGSNVRRPE